MNFQPPDIEDPRDEDAHIRELLDRIAELERRNARLVDAAEQVCKKLEHPTASVTSIDMWNLREALDATSADTGAWLQAEIVKRLEAENEYGFTPIFTRFRQDGCGCKYAEYELQLTDCGGEFKGNAPRLYRLPSPLATPEERKE